jgi:predicted transcriptional regulator
MKGVVMDLKTIQADLGLHVQCGVERLGATVTGGYVGDLLSDVMANSTSGQVWVTRQVHQNIVAVATLKELSGIIIVQGAMPDKDTVAKAENEGLPILSTSLAAFEVVGRIHRLLAAA